jgi:hypothetical protein
MWEAIMMLRQIVSMGSVMAGSPGTRAMPLALPAETLKGMIRLSFAAYRLSLPLSNRLNANHDQKIA